MIYTKTSFQRCLFEDILAIYITSMSTYYKYNTNFCYTVIIIKNNQKYQNSCCVIGSRVSVSSVLMILQYSDCLDCLDYYIVVLQKSQHSTGSTCRYILYLLLISHIGREMENLQDLCHHLQFFELKTLYRCIHKNKGSDLSHTFFLSDKP